MRKKFYLLVLLLILVINKDYAQRGLCGTDHNHMDHAQQLFEKAGLVRNFTRGANNTIPVKFHIVADNEGKGGVALNNVLNQFARLNTDFKAHDIQFYLSSKSSFSFVNNTKIFTDARNNESSMRLLKDPNALNVFIVKSIPASSSAQTLLGYYSSTNDFVVIIKKEADLNTNTLPHEIGHFFNLRHTFNGWETEPYDVNMHGARVTLDFAPESSVRVELMNKSNCTTAADQVCDTPPDYNFGSSTSVCQFTRIVFDKNNDTIKPMINNQMSYFSNCQKFDFTQGQATRMKTNIANVLRTNLMRNYTPNTNTFPNSSNLIKPSNGLKIDTYNFIEFEWENQGADYYLLEIKNSSEYYTYIIEKNNKLTVKNLLANKLYVWSVRAFNDGFAINNSTNATRTLRTGAILLGNKEIDEIKYLNLYPNPSINGMTELNLTLYKPIDVEIEIVNISGKKVFSKNEKLSEGENKIMLDISNFAKGYYMVQVKNDHNVTHKTLIIE